MGVPTASVSSAPAKPAASSLSNRFAETALFLRREYVITLASPGLCREEARGTSRVVNGSTTTFGSFGANTMTAVRNPLGKASVRRRRDRDAVEREQTRAGSAGGGGGDVQQSLWDSAPGID